MTPQTIDLSQATTITTIGPTKLGGDVNMVTANTWYGLTLVSALAAGGKYIIGGWLSGVATAQGDNCSVRLIDTTNNVFLATRNIDTPTAIAFRFGGSLVTIYSGYAGTPNVAIQALNGSNNGGAVKATDLNGNGGATGIWAVKIG